MERKILYGNYNNINCMLHIFKCTLTVVLIPVSGFRGWIAFVAFMDLGTAFRSYIERRSFIGDHSESQFIDGNNINVEYNLFVSLKFNYVVIFSLYSFQVISLYHVSWGCIQY